MMITQILNTYLAGTDQNEEKASLPSLPKQIQDDLHKFRKAQSRRMLHERLHSYINHLQDNTKTQEQNLPLSHDGKNSDTPENVNESLLIKDYSPNANIIHQNHSSLSMPPPLTSGLSPNHNVHQNNSTTCVSGKSSPIGKQLQELSISENDPARIQRNPSQLNILNNNSFHDQEISNRLLLAEHNSISSVPNIFNTLTGSNSNPLQGTMSPQSNPNVSNNDDIGFNIF